MQQRRQSSLKLLLLVLLGVGLVQCGHSGKEGSLPGRTWANKMQEMSSVLVNLYPYLSSRRAFNAPENRSEIQRGTERLASLAHGVNQERAKSGVKDIDKDPYMSMISNNLDRELNLAVEGLRSGKRDFARVVLKNTTSMCVRCHSRGQWGPEFVDWQKDKTFQTLRPLEKGELLSAVRRYDQAIGQYESILKDKQLAANESYDWVKAANSALNISVRAKQDPKKAEQIVKTILSNKAVPAFQRNNAEDWMKEIKGWKRQKKTRGSLLSQAERIMGRARKKEDYWGDRSTYVHYLRASALLHDYLRTKSSTDNQAKALYLLGQCYEMIADMGGGDTNEFYYKACIQRAPHTEIALGCYERFEQNMFLDYSGGGEFHFPAGAMEYLRALRALATPVEKESHFDSNNRFQRQ
jgi:hypothetical protein